MLAIYLFLSPICILLLAGMISIAESYFSAQNNWSVDHD
ncbi:MAG: hypothetical protein ACI96N_000846 [Arenicella sp.]|jgi:hypothetical protein